MRCIDKGIASIYGVLHQVGVDAGLAVLAVAHEHLPVIKYVVAGLAQPGLGKSAAAQHEDRFVQ